MTSKDEIPQGNIPISFIDPIKSLPFSITVVTIRDTISSWMSKLNIHKLQHH